MRRLLHAGACAVAVLVAVSCPLHAQLFTVDSAGHVTTLTSLALEDQDFARGAVPDSALRVDAFPADVAREVAACATAHGARAEVALPRVVVLPSHDAMFVHDVKVDSLYHGVVTISRPVIAWAFVDHDAIAVLEGYATNAAVLRHELLHFYAWRALHKLGHPPALYAACSPDQLR